jgi:hypothetical protein
MGILPMFLGICTGGTPVRLMGKRPMLLFQRAVRGMIGVMVGFQDEALLLNHLDPLNIAIPFEKPLCDEPPGTCGNPVK